MVSAAFKLTDSTRMNVRTRGASLGGGRGGSLGGVVVLVSARGVSALRLDEAGRLSTGNGWVAFRVNLVKSVP